MDFDETQFLKRVPDKLRNLGFFESLCDEEFMHENLLITTSLLISVNNKFLINHEVLQKAMSLWVKNHPFLQSTIHRDLDKKTGKSKLNLPKFYIKMNKNIEDYNNLEYFENVDNTINWPNMAERELKTPFDFINGPLWRMKVIKIYDNPTKSFDNYAMIFTLSHAISDGRNSFSIIIQYLNILDKLLKGITVDKKDLVEIPSNLSWEKMVEDMKSRSKIKSCKNDFDCLNSVTHRIPSGIGNVSNGTNGRINHFIIDKKDLERLMQKMKSNEPSAKLTSLLLVIICLAFRRTCIIHKVDDIPLDNFVVSVPVCVRDKLSIKTLQMGSYVSNLETTVEFSKKSIENERKTIIGPVLNKVCYYIMISLIFPIYFFLGKILHPDIITSFLPKNKIVQSENVGEKSIFYFYKDFWSIVAENSANLHKCISENLELELPKKELIEIMLENNFDFSSFYPINFTVSNLGKMENTKCNSAIKVLESYVCVPCKEKRFGGFLYFGLTTIDNSLCCAISYNEKFFSEKFVDDVKTNILKLIESIIV